MSGKRKSSKRSIPLFTITILAGIIGIQGYLSDAESQTTKRFYFINSGGAVMLNHQQHVETTESCGDCHHEILLADERNPCSDCHDDEMEEEDFTHSEFMDIDSHSCTICHQTNEETKPQSCTNCHPDSQEEEQTNTSCTECHDDDYDMNLLTHDEMQEIEDHSCEGCHNAKAVSDIFHQSCTRCHLIENESKFLTSQNKVKCEACHLK